MFAVIKTGGKQYIVEKDQTLRVEKLPEEKGGKVLFKDVLLISDGASVQVGAPTVKDAVVEAEVVDQTREKKKLIFRYHSKTRYRKRKGHRQHVTDVKITSIK